MCGLGNRHDAESERQRHSRVPQACVVYISQHYKSKISMRQRRSQKKNLLGFWEKEEDDHKGSHVQSCVESERCKTYKLGLAFLDELRMHTACWAHTREDRGKCQPENARETVVDEDRESDADLAMGQGEAFCSINIRDRSNS